MTEEIKSRIAKLLALARNNPNEHEADAALRRAAKMMAEHGVTEKEVTGSKIIMGSSLDVEKIWKRTLAQSAALLYGTVACYDGYMTSVEFTGKPSNVEATMETFKWLVDQVEYLYKHYLPKGLSQSDRAHHRKRFKDACATGIFHRVVVIMRSLEQEKIPGTSLVVLTQVKQDESEAKDFLNDEIGVKTSKARAIARVDHSSISAAIGLRASQSVELNKKVKS